MATLGIFKQNVGHSKICVRNQTCSSLSVFSERNTNSSQFIEILLYTHYFHINSLKNSDFTAIDIIACFCSSSCGTYLLFHPKIYRSLILTNIFLLISSFYENCDQTIILYLQQTIITEFL